MIRVIALLLAALGAAGAHAGGLKFDLTECLATTAEVTVKVYPSRSALVSEWERLTGREVERGQKLHGFSTREGKVHTLHVARITSLGDGDMATLGHELIHALCGDYHH